MPELNPAAHTGFQCVNGCLWPVLVPLLLAFGSGVLAQPPSSELQVRQSFHRAKTHFHTSPTNAVAAWELARASFDLADVAQDDFTRKEAALAGVAAAREAIAMAPHLAPGHYYLALNLGQTARAKRIAALRILREMERALLTAARLDCEFDHAGPDRSLGMLYLQAPSWPASVGSRSKARTHLERAVELAPDYPENRIVLAEAFSRWGEIKALERELKAIEELLPKARMLFSGLSWKASWQSWESRWSKLQDTHEHLLANPRVSPAERGARPVQ